MLRRIDTERLCLEPFEDDDADAAFGWLGDPEVMRFTPRGVDASLEATRTRIAYYRAHQARHGFSRWAIRRHDGTVPFGDAGLMVANDSAEIDLGFRLARPFWGRGFATEVAAAWVRAAFSEFGIAHLTAFAHLQNAASLRVLSKVGFMRGAIREVGGMQAVTFWIERRGAQNEVLGD